MYRLFASVLSAIGLVAIATVSPHVLAAKGGNGKGNGGGNGGGDDPPAACVNSQPSFTFYPDNRRGPDDTLMLSSFDGCTTRPFPEGGSGSLRLSEDGISGVLVEAWESTVQATQFSIDTPSVAGWNLTVESIDTLIDESNAPPGGYSFWFADVWGNADLSEAYFSLTHSINSEDNRIWLVNLHDPSERLEIFPAAPPAVGTAWDWTCPAGVMYPQMVAGCAMVNFAIWNASGTRLYMGGIVNNWHVRWRMDVQRTDSNGDPLTLSDWTFGVPEVVFAGSRESGVDYAEPGGPSIQPAAGDLYSPPETEWGIVNYIDRTGQNTVGGSVLVDLDYCAAHYKNVYGTGMVEPISGDWLLCSSSLVGGHGPWQSHESFLTDPLKSKLHSIYRHTVVGGTGQAELVIEHAQQPDTGL